MNITKIFALLIPFVLLVQSANSAIVSAEVSGSGISTLNASGTIANTDSDGDGLSDDLPIARLTFTLDSNDFVTVDAHADGFMGYLYVFNSANEILFLNNTDLLDGSSQFVSQLSAGTYTVTLGAYGYTLEDAMLGYDEDQFFEDYSLIYGLESGAWSLTVTASSTEVPVPAALPLFLSALIGLAGIARRRR